MYSSSKAIFSLNTSLQIGINYINAPAYGDPLMDYGELSGCVLYFLNSHFAHSTKMYQGHAEGL